MTSPFHPRDWWRRIVRAGKQIRLLDPARIGGAVAISALNLLWQGHGVLKSLPTTAAFLAVAAICYLIAAAIELAWLFVAAPPPSIAERLAEKPAPQVETVDPLVEQLEELPPFVLKEGTLLLADEMKKFEARSDESYLRTLVPPRPRWGISREQRDEEIDRQSSELMQKHLATWRAYRERFYRPARAFRDELRKRLGIRNPAAEPSIPALDKAVLTGAKPITDAANYLVMLARRLK